MKNLTHQEAAERNKLAEENGWTFHKDEFGLIQYATHEDGRIAHAPEEIPNYTKHHWTKKPPGPGLWWHANFSSKFSKPVRLNLSPDGVLRHDSLADRDGIFITAESMGGFWWTEELLRPDAATPYDIEPNHV